MGNLTLVEEEQKEKTEDKTNRVVERLRKRYHEELFITEFRNAPSGFTHRADVLVVYLHPSRGKIIEYFEVKALRSDWIKEKNSPSKSDEIAKHCDKIWLVTAEEEIAQIDEIPETWGWMDIVGGKVKYLKDAPFLKANPISKHFLAALLKRGADRSSFIHVDAIEERMELEKQIGRNESKITISKYFICP